MAGYTKADFDSDYSFNIEAYMWPPPVGIGEAGGRPLVRLHYQRGVVGSFVEDKWDVLVPHIGLTAADHLVLAGCAFGWGLERIEALVPGINAVGVDISDYIAAEKGNDDSAEIAEYITAAGLDPASGKGLQIMQEWSTPGPKANVVVLQEDMKTNQSRNAVRQALGNNTPTWIISEDMVQDMTDLEITDLMSELDKLTNTAKVHVVTTLTDRTVAQLQTITGHRIIYIRQGAIVEDTG